VPGNPAMHVGPGTDSTNPAGQTTTVEVTIGFRPDVMGSRTDQTIKYVGDNVYKTTSVDGPKITNRNPAVTYQVKLENDGNLAETIKLKAALSGDSSIGVAFRAGPYPLSNMTTTGRDVIAARPERRHHRHVPRQQWRAAR
jgi:hypothetical protein